MAPVFIFLEVVAVRELEEVVSIIFAEHFFMEKEVLGEERSAPLSHRRFFLKTL